MNLTVILAAGQRNSKNMAQGLTSSIMLNIVNGRPVLSWVLSDLLKKTNDYILLVCDNADEDLIAYYNKRYLNHPNLHLSAIESSPSIIFSLKESLIHVDKVFKPQLVRIILGDTLLKDASYSLIKDCVYVSNYQYSSLSWCVVSLNDQGKIERYYDKTDSLFSPRYKALVGRYEFCDFELLKQCVQKSLEYNKKELSAVLQSYGQVREIAALEIDSTNWIDFGHLEGVARAQQQLIESRNFNSIYIHPLLPEIRKKSNNVKKINQEVYWYSSLPHELQSLTPRVLKYETLKQVSILTLEYYGYGTLAEKFVYFDLPISFWEFALNRLICIINLFKEKSINCKSNEIDLFKIYETKTWQRLEILSQQNSYWCDLLEQNYITINKKEYKNLPLLRSLITKKNKDLVKSGIISIIHGDLCFNNILFDMKSGVIKLIDPRGEFGAEVFTIYGDLRYDLAKLRHSFCGNYDCIIENNFYLIESLKHDFVFEIFKENVSVREKLFDELITTYGYNVEDVKFIEGLLFLSMIPLHQDSFIKQQAFWVSGVIKLNNCFFKE